MAPLFPRSGPGESSSPTSAVLLRCYDFPPRIPGHLFVSLPGSTQLEASRRSSVEPGCCFSRYVRGMIIEDQPNRGAGRISGVETLEEFDELPAAVAVSDECMDLAGKQVDSGQQAQRAMTFVLVIPREGRVDAGLGRQIGCGRCDGLDSRLFVVGNDRHSLDGFARLGGGSL